MSFIQLILIPLTGTLLLAQPVLGSGDPDTQPFQSDRTKGVVVAQHTYFQFPFRGIISDLAQCRVDGTNQILILAQNHGILINDQKIVQKEWTLTRCFDPIASQVGDSPCIIYCRGGGFSPVYASDLNGNELWKFDRPGTISTVARDHEGRFYVCTLREINILEPDGKFIKSLNGHIYDIKFVDPTTVLTISAVTNKARGRQIDIRDANLNRLSSFPIESDGRNIVAYHWPRTKHVCYVAKQHFFVLNHEGKTVQRVSLDDVVVGVGSAVVRDDVGEDYLALLVLYKPGKAASKLFIFSKRCVPVYEKTLPPSFAVSTLGLSNRLYVGVGATKIVEYQLRHRQ